MFVCQQCQQEFIPKDRRYSVFCSRSCAAQINNRLSPKRKASALRQCECGNGKEKNASCCVECLRKKQERLALTKPISTMMTLTASRAKYNQIRHWARKLMERYGPSKACKVCGFNILVEVCHLKPIIDFPETALMGEVNSLSNLVYLCPNHHAMLDKGLLDITLP